MVGKTRVLFLCTASTARSQMAEAFLREYGGQSYEAYSAGCVAGEEIHHLAVRVMEEVGIDAGDQCPKEIAQFMGRVHFGYQITVCKRGEEKEFNCPVYPGMGLNLYWPFDDPRAFEGTEEEKLRKFREVRDQIEAEVRSWVRERELA